MIFQYIFIILCCAIIITLAIIKIKYPFWNNQPVFHTYDYIRTLYKQPFIVHSNGPYKTKFIDQSNIKTKALTDDIDPIIGKITDLLQCHYMTNETIDHIIKPQDIYAILSGHGEPSFVSIYTLPEYILKPNSSNDGVEIENKYKRIGCVTSRCVNMYIRPTKTETVYNGNKVYFMDYLCTHREQDTKKISRSLIQTHEYNQRLINKNVQISLLKKEGELFTGIRPLITYETHSYALSNLQIPRMESTYTVELLKSGSMDSYLNYFLINGGFEQKTTMYDLLVLPDIGNIMAQIKQKLLYIACLRHGPDILGFYFMKDIKRHYDDTESQTLSIIGSAQNCKDNRLFYIGFMHALRQVIHTNPDYKILNIENIGHNQTITSYWNAVNRPISVTSAAYYSYNYIYPCSPIDIYRCLILL